MMCLTPLTPATASSTRLVTWFCSSDGAAPDCVTVIETIGMSMFGKRVIGSCRKLNTPSTISTMNRTIDGIGFRIAQAEMLSRITAPLRPRGLVGDDGTHRVAVAQEAAGPGDDEVAGRDALLDLDEAVGGEAGPHAAGLRPCCPRRPGPSRPSAP